MNITLANILPNVGTVPGMEYQIQGFRAFFLLEHALIDIGQE